MGRGQSCAVPSCALPDANPSAHCVQLRCSPPRLPSTAPPCVSAVPVAGAAAGGQRDPCFLSLRGAPGPAPQCGPCSSPTPGIPGNFRSGARLSPAGGRGQAGGHISRACPLGALALSPAPGIGTPNAVTPPPGLALPMATSPGTRAGDTVTLPGYFGEDKSGRRQVRGSGSRRRGGE